MTAGRSERNTREGVISRARGSREGTGMVGERIERRGGVSSMDVIGRIIAFSCKYIHTYYITVVGNLNPCGPHLAVLAIIVGEYIYINSYDQFHKKIGGPIMYYHY